MQVYPEKNEKLELSAAEKSFLRTIDRAFLDDEVAYYVLHINPRKKDIGGGKPELFNMLIIPEGILLLRFIEVDGEDVASMTIKALSNPVVNQVLTDDIRETLEGSKYLVGKNNSLRFELEITFVFPEIDYSKIEPLLNNQEREFCKKHVITKDEIKRIRKNGKEVITNKMTAKDAIEEDDLNSIFQRLCPEITIPRKYVLDEHERIEIKESELSYADRSVVSYRLDDWQIDMVNRISRGNQLILACAGSGKSVLLISKCFKLAGLNPSEPFLITCYNRNLKDYYQWAIAQAGFKDKNVKCVTFLGLCRQLLEKNEIPLPHNIHGKDSEYYEQLFEKANRALEEGQIQDRYYGIFIDEIQIFRPEWYRFCFNLLKSKNESDHYFVIAGDKSQDIKNNIKRGKAPWQGGGSDYPEYRGKTIPIETNYRNSKPINDAIDRYVERAKNFGLEIGVDLEADPELFLRGTAYRPGSLPEVKELTDLSNEGEAAAICDSVKALLEKGYSEVDIAIIFYNRRVPFTTKGWKTHYYYPIPAIKKIFLNEGWEEPDVLVSSESEGATYGSRRGVTIATIEGSLGLDFRAVILAGLRSLGVHEKARIISDFKDVSEEEKIRKQEAYKKNVNFVYTGCTRAKDELTVVLSAPRGESIYMDLIRDSIGE